MQTKQVSRVSKFATVTLATLALAFLGIGCASPTPEELSVNQQASYRKLAAPVLDQVIDGPCIAFAFAGAVKAATGRTINPWFTYKLSGSSGIVSMNDAMNVGFLEDPTFTETTSITPEHREQASKFRLKDWSFIASGEILASIQSGHPVLLMAGVKKPSIFMNKAVAESSDFDCCGANHAMIVLDINQQGLIVQNSWGIGSHYEGAFILPWEVLDGPMYMYKEIVRLTF